MWPFKKKSDSATQSVHLFIRFHDGSHLIEAYDYEVYERMRYLVMVTSLEIESKKVKEIQLIKLKPKIRTFRFNLFKTKRAGKLVVAHA